MEEDSMELLTSLITLFFFSFLYSLGYKKEDSIIELIGILGFMLLGILIWATGTQITAIDGNGILYLRDVPSVAATIYGFIIGGFSVILLWHWITTIREMKKLEMTG